MSAPTSKRPEEREFAIDSGASVHMMSKKDSSSCELDTLRRSRKPNFCTNAYKRGGTSFRSRSQFLRDSAIIRRCACCLSLGKLCIDHGYSYEWVRGQKPRLTKEGKTIVCKTDNFVPLVIPGLSTSSGSNSSSTSGIVNKISP